ncbi:MAG: PKD domain-containing protein [Rubrivivax sp.]
MHQRGGVDAARESVIKRCKWVAAIATCGALLLGCGGGGGSGPAQPPATPLPATVQLVMPAAVEVAADNAFGSDVPVEATGLQFAWDFGDGARSTEPRPRHAYASAGRYTVRLVLSDGAGRQVTAQGSVDAVPHLRVHGLDCSGPADTGWCREIAQGWKPALRELQWPGTGTAWAVGEDGFVMRTTDAGSTWVAQRLPGAPRLAGLQALDTQRGWVVGWAAGGEGRAWRTRDGSSTWAAAEAAVPVAYPLRLQALSDEVLLVWGAREGSAPAITEDGGRSWRVLPLDVHHVEADGTLWGLPVTPEGQTYNAHPAVAFRKSTDRGRTFVAESGWPADGVVDWMGVSDEGWAWALSSTWGGELGADRQFTLLTRRGSTAPWTATRLPTTDRVAEVLVTPKGSMAVTIGTLATSLALWSSGDGGLSWASRSWPVSFVGQWGLIDGRSLQAAFQRNERPFVSTDGGLNWLRDRPGVALPDLQQVVSVQRSPLGLLLRSSTQYGRNARSSWQASVDGGGRWTDLWQASANDPRQAITELWFRDRRRGLAVTSGGALLDTDDGGRGWRVRDPATVPGGGAAPLARLQTAPDGALWALAGPRLVRSADDGRSWQDAPGQPPMPVEIVRPAQDLRWFDATHLMVSQTSFSVTSPHVPGRFTTFVSFSDDAGRSWRGAPVTDCERVAFSSPSDGVCLRSIVNHYSTDGGQTWQPAGGASFDTRRVQRVVLAGGAGAAARWWALAADRVWRSDDGGRSWQAVSLPAMPLRLDDNGALVPAMLRDIAWVGRRGWIVGDEGVVFFSDDGGASWARQPSGVHSTLNAVFALDADSLWVGAEQTVLATASGGR